jgi:arsenate reductase
MTAPRRVLFLCTHNSARSQMAEGLLRSMGGDRYDVVSAGTVTTSVRMEAIAAMREIGIDIGGHTSKTLARFLGQPFDEVITVCDDANDACPIFPGARNRRHWSIPDPSNVEGSEGDRLRAFRNARDQIKHHIQTELLNV